MKETQLNHFYRSWRQIFYGDDTLADFKSMRQRVKKKKKMQKNIFLGRGKSMSKASEIKRTWSILGVERGPKNWNQ